MYTVVTGAAGFIGANLVKALNERGVTKIIAVDNLTKADKFRNLIDCEIADYVDKNDFIERIQAGHYDGEIDAIFHEGACSDTMETDGRYMMENNYRYSMILLDWCQDQDVQFLYASSAATYGGASVFKEERQYEGPLNVYGYSKFLFDQIVRQRLAQNPSSQIVGFRYFNVYGPRETHKGRMASVAFHNFNQFRADGRVKLFEGTHGYENGGQMRDFVYIGDVPREIRDFQPRFGAGAEFQRCGGCRGQRLPEGKRRGAAGSGGIARAGPDRVHHLSGSLEGQVSGLYPGRSDPLAGGWLRCADGHRGRGCRPIHRVAVAQCIRPCRISSAIRRWCACSAFPAPRTRGAAMSSWPSWKATTRPVR